MQQPNRGGALRTLKWSSTILACLILAAFVLSTRRFVTWDSPSLQYEAGLYLGTFVFGWRPEGWRLENEQYPPRAGWSYGGFGGAGALTWSFKSGESHSWRAFCVPLWIPFALAAAPAGILWYRDRRHTQAVVARLKARLCPASRRKLRVWLVALFCLIHALACVLVGLPIVDYIYPFFVDYQSGDPVIVAMELGLVLLFLTSPLWGILWAWLWVRFRNRLFDAQPSRHCAECGYDLTGNISGRCPECGKPTERSVKSLNFAAPDRDGMP